MVPTVPEVVACLVYLHAVMIFHNASEGVLHLMQVLVGIPVHLCIAVVAEVGRVIVAVPCCSLVLAEIAQF